MLAIEGIVAFLALFVVFVFLGFWGGRWRRGDMSDLGEWALAGRRLGTVLVWFLVGADLYTAYTFISVPSGVYAGIFGVPGSGAFYFFAVPYVALTFGVAIVVMPKLWKVSHEKGYITTADFVKGTFNSRTLAMLVAIVGIIAELPYIALQIVGMQAVLAAMLNGVGDVTTISEVALVLAFVVLAAFTYTSGLRGATLTAVMKDLLIFLGVIAVLAVIASSGGFGGAFSAASKTLSPYNTGTQHTIAVLPTLPVTLTNAYWSTFLISALALYLYPHAVNGVLSAQDPEKVRKSTSLLPFYGLGLGVLAMFGVLVYGSSAAMSFLHGYPLSGTGVTQGVLVVPALILTTLPSWFAGVALLGVFIGGLVPAAIMAIAQANLLTRNIVKEFRPNITPQGETTLSKWASVVFKFIALGFVFVVVSTYAIQLQLFGGIMIVQTLPAVFLGLFTSRLNKHSLITGLLVGEVVGVYLMELKNNFSIWHYSTYALPSPFGILYIGLIALAVNLAIVAVWSLVLPPKRDAASHA
ncbi:MAG: sodium:solute symporter [Nitrososphaerota archaeon]|nr:sodium:solute symporter [Nitrososphaerota archaeon]